MAPPLWRHRARNIIRPKVLVIRRMAHGQEDRQSQRKQKRPQRRSLQRRQALPLKRAKSFLWRMYQALAPHEKIIVQLHALLGRPVTNVQFIRDPQGSAGSRGRMEDFRSMSESTKIIELCFPANCSTPSMAARPMCFTKSRWKHRKAKTRRLWSTPSKTRPRSVPRDNPKHYGYHKIPLSADWDLLRRVRLAVYANDEAEFDRLHAKIRPEAKGPAGAAQSYRLHCRPARRPGSTGATPPSGGDRRNLSHRTAR